MSRRLNHARDAEFERLLPEARAGNLCVSHLRNGVRRNCLKSTEGADKVPYCSNCFYDAPLFEVKVKNDVKRHINRESEAFKRRSEKAEKMTIHYDKNIINNTATIMKSRDNAHKIHQAAEEYTPNIRKLMQQSTYDQKDFEFMEKFKLEPVKKEVVEETEEEAEEEEEEKLQEPPRKRSNSPPTTSTKPSVQPIDQSMLASIFLTIQQYQKQIAEYAEKEAIQKKKDAMQNARNKAAREAEKKARAEKPNISADELDEIKAEARDAASASFISTHGPITSTTSTTSSTSYPQSPSSVFNNLTLNENIAKPVEKFDDEY